MTALTPEENQGGGLDQSLSTAFSDSSGDLSPPPLDPKAVEEPSATAAAATATTTNARSSDPVTCISPDLDPSQVLPGLERDTLSPRRYSVDVECDSIASDYSELGGTLKDIEKDVHFLDRDALTAAITTGESGSFLEQLGLRRDSEFQPVDKQEHETEADFQKRVRKVNILSLAQEFALLKKVDAQACPINFHRVNAGKVLRHSATPSPVPSRGQSLDRTHRAQSKSPLRDTMPANFTDRGRLQPCGAKDSSTSPSSDTKPVVNSILTSNPAAKHKPTNALLEDLPINEARRRSSSSDLPANMRPERRAAGQPARGGGGGGGDSAAQLEAAKNRPVQSGAASNPSSNPQADGPAPSQGDGDFDVYNIETAVPNLDWKILQQQLDKVESEEKKRLEACKNEREEIRRRLAMTDDDRDQDDDDGLSCSMLRNPRLQTSLEGAQNMQICFIPDDILDDDDDDDDTAADISQATTVAATGHAARDEEDEVSASTTSEEDALLENEASRELGPSLSNWRPDPRHIASRQSQLQTEATLALAQASTMARMQLEVEKQAKKKSPIADMVGIPTLGNGRRLRLSSCKLGEMNVAQLQVLVNDLHTQIELLNEDLVHLLIERDDLHMEQDSMLVDIEDLTSHCHDPKATNNNKTSHNNNHPLSRKNMRHK